MCRYEHVSVCEDMGVCGASVGSGCVCVCVFQGLLVLCVPRGIELRDTVGMGRGFCHDLLLLEGSRVT